MRHQDAENVCPGVELRCPECRRPLKVARILGNDAKPLICGGCGRRFDCSDLPPAGPSAESDGES